MNVRKLRLQRNWSQEQLAQVSGLSIRTIQRIERGQTPGLESVKSLAAVFDVHVESLLMENDMTQDDQIDKTEQQAMEYVRDIKGFYSHAIKYVVVISLLFVINLATDASYIWAWWPMLGWGIGLLSHGLNVFEVFNLFSPSWERRQIEKRLGRKL